MRRDARVACLTVGLIRESDVTLLASPPAAAPTVPPPPLPPRIAAGSYAENDGFKRKPAVYQDGDHPAHPAQFHDVFIESRLCALIFYLFFRCPFLSSCFGTAYLFVKLSRRRPPRSIRRARCCEQMLQSRQTGCREVFVHPPLSPPLPPSDVCIPVVTMCSGIKCYVQ